MSPVAIPAINEDSGDFAVIRSMALHQDKPSSEFYARLNVWDSPATLTCLGPNVVVPILSHLEKVGEEQELSHDAVIQTFSTGRNLAMGGSAVAILKSEAQSASLCIPGKAPLAILGANQIRIFERLVAAHLSGSPDVKTAVLIEDTGVQSPQQAFRKPKWDSILNVYIGKGPTRGYWRLVV